MATNGSKLTKDERVLINEALDLKIISLERSKAKAPEAVARAIQTVVQDYRNLQNRVNSGELEL